MLKNIPILSPLIQVHFQDHKLPLRNVSQKLKWFFFFVDKKDLEEKEEPTNH